jgi:chromosome segregation ATPase
VSLPISSTEDILKALREHPEWRSKVLEELLSSPQEIELAGQKILTQDLLKLPDRLEELRVELLAEIKELATSVAAFASASRDFTTASSAALKALTAAQVRTEDRLAGLKTTSDGLLRGQKLLAEALRSLIGTVRTLGERIDQLTHAQGETQEELIQLTQRVEELAQAQAQLTQRVDQFTQRLEELTERVDQLAHTVQELSIAQRQRQGILTNLHKRVDKLAQQVSGLALESKRYGDKMGELDGAVIQQSVIRKLESYLYDCLSRVWHLDRRALDLADTLP